MTCFEFVDVEINLFRVQTQALQVARRCDGNCRTKTGYDEPWQAAHISGEMILQDLWVEQRKLAKSRGDTKPERVGWGELAKPNSE